MSNLVQPKTTSASLRIVVAIVGAGICALAVWRLGLAVHQALTTGTVLLLDTKPMARGVVYPYPWVDAWAYFVGCALSAAGGVLGRLHTGCSGPHAWLSVRCRLARVCHSGVQHACTRIRAVAKCSRTSKTGHGAGTSRPGSEGRCRMTSPRAFCSDGQCFDSFFGGL